MKRDPRLQDLSREHHYALVLARRATRAALADDTTATEVWNEVSERFHLDLAPHFEIEERYLLAALDDGPLAALAQRTREEHAELRRLVCDEPGDIKDRLTRFGAALRDHVRFEERELFPAAESQAGEGVLEAVAAAWKRNQTQPGDA